MCYPCLEQSGYDDIKALITKKRVDTRLLETIKLQFVNDIASPRRYGSIGTLTDLIDCLESLDVLSAYNVEGFCIIDEFLRDDEILGKLLNYIEPPLEDDLNIYTLQRTRENSKLEAESEIKKPNFVSTQQSLCAPKFSETKRKAVYEIIAKEIGRNWRNFGRELGVRNGDLDSIEIRYVTDLRSRVYAIFEIFDNDTSCERKMHLYRICEALDKCRRKDLGRNVQKIMLNDDLQ